MQRRSSGVRGEIPGRSRGDPGQVFRVATSVSSASRFSSSARDSFSTTLMAYFVRSIRCTALITSENRPRPSSSPSSYRAATSSRVTWSGKEELTTRRQVGGGTAAGVAAGWSASASADACARSGRSNGGVGGSCVPRRGAARCWACAQCAQQVSIAAAVRRTSASFPMRRLICSSLISNSTSAVAAGADISPRLGGRSDGDWLAAAMLRTDRREPAEVAGLESVY